MFDDLYREDVERALRLEADTPRVQPKKEPGFFSGLGGAAWRGPTKAGIETARAGVNLLDAYGKAFAFTEGAAKEETIDRIFEQSETSKELGQLRRSFEVDPETQGTAAQIVDGFTKFGTKAVTYGLTTGPLAPIFFGVDEGVSEGLRLADKGVDTETAIKGGAVHGATSAAAVALPVAGKTVQQTIGLTIAGGPVAFMGEQAAINEILDDAGYEDIAREYDPFDVVGLTVSTLGPGAFGAAVHGARRARARKAAAPTDPAPDAVPQEAVDAAHVQALAEHESQSSLFEPTDVAGQGQHAQAVREAQRAIEEARAPRLEVTADEGQVATRLGAEQLAETPIVPRGKGLSAADRVIEDRLAAKVVDVDRAAAEYAQLPDAEGGKVLNTDTARELSPDYLADRTKSAAVHEPASWFIKQMYARKLAEPPAPGELPIVMFTAGGTGAGKSSGIAGIEALQQMKVDAQIVYDTNMNAYASSREKIDQALAAGKNVALVLTLRDPVKALTEGALPRAMRQEKKFGTGRTVPLMEHLRTHVGARSTVLQLANDFADDPRVLIRVVDNSRGRGEQRVVGLEELAGKPYDESVLLDQLRRALEQEREAGRISEPVYRGFAEGLSVEGRADADAVQPVDGSARGVDRGEPAPDLSREGRAGQEVAPAIEAAPSGRAARVVTERGTRIDTRFSVVEADDLVTSHDNLLRPNPDFPPELQPRDRSRTASELQITRIENALDPELLGDSPKASDGAPIVGRDAVVESGNARTIALRRAYEASKAEEYRAWLAAHAAEFGLDPQAIARMRRPVLVRIGQGDYDRVAFVRQANEASVAAMSPAEQAMLDSARLPDLELLSARDDGTINLGESRDFIRQFIETVAPAERAALVTAEGGLSQAGLSRIRNAIFSRAYGDTQIVAMMAESTDANVKNILAGMLRAAPAVARLRELVEAGARQPIDVAPDLVQAVRTFSKLREDGMTVEQFLAQGSLVDDGLTPEVTQLLRGIGESARAPKRIAELITSLVDTVDALGDPRQAGMFGDAAPSQAEVVGRAVDVVRDSAAEQVLAARPDLVMQMEDGSTVSAREALDAARAELEQAKVDAQAFDAAVSCFLARG